MDWRGIGIAVVILGALSGCAANRKSDLRVQGDPCTRDPMETSLLCGNHTFPVNGTVLYTGDDDEPKVRNLQIMAGFYRDGEWIELRPVDAVVRENGEFSFEAGASFSVRESCRNGKWNFIDIYLDAHHLFRADGCQDNVVTSSKDSNVHIVTMDCLP